MINLQNQHCLITGASRGLGARLATTFWDAGASLTLVGRSVDGLNNVASSLPARCNQQVIVRPFDLADPSVPLQLIADMRSTLDTIDVLVNNAAIQGPIGTAWENDWTAWQTALQINLVAPIALCNLCVPWMAQRSHGKIINLSGGGATSPRPRFSAYAVAKAGLVRFSETLAEETRDLGISVNCIAPGAMDTTMLQTVLQAGPEAVGHREYEQARHARQQGGEGIERAVSLALFLASTASDGITGKLISAVWDPWASLPEHLDDLRSTDVYTLRRIVPKDRGLEWGE